MTKLTPSERKATIAALQTADFSHSPELRSRLVHSLTTDRLAHLEPPTGLPSAPMVALLLVAGLSILGFLAWALR